MNIRLAQPHEAACLAEVDSSRRESAHWSMPQWQEELAQPAARVWVAVAQGRLVGFLGVRGVAGSFEILNVAVLPGFSRQGIATQLLTCALADLQATGGGRVTLEVRVDNLPARGLYQKAGFEVCGQRPRFYADGTDALIMGKTL